MSKRHRDAVGVVLGACNPSGIAHSIVEACKEIREEKTFAGTASITEDPAIKLMVFQLAYICGLITGAEEFARAPYYRQCEEQCEARKDS